MNKFCFLSTACLGLLVAGCMGNSSDIVGSDAINQPGNLVSNINSITKSGMSTLQIKNIGHLPVMINNGTIEDNQTNDNIDAEHSDCYGKTLSPNQTCNMSVDVSTGEAGISTVELNTSNGTYDMNLNIDTSGDGVVETDIKTLQTTKEEIINVMNKGSVPLLITHFNLEDTNQTLKLTDINCLNTPLHANQSCQLKAQASTEQQKQHVISFATSNHFLPKQQISLFENTDVSKLKLNLENENGWNDSNSLDITTAGVRNWEVTNIGSSDIHIQKLNLNGSNIGAITKNECDNTTLQSGDSCNMQLVINQDAHGQDSLNINTLEKLSTNPKYQLVVNDDNLTVDNDSNDIVIHTNSSKVVNVKNSSNFDIVVDDIKFDNNKLNLTSGCYGLLRPNDTCNLSIKALGTQDDNNSITFTEFNGDVIKKINLHINNGISIINENQGSGFYNVIPQDNYFYQIFTINNPTSNQVNIGSTIKNSDIVHKVLSNELPNYSFILPNCFNNDGTINILPDSTCELILREPKEYNALAELINDQVDPNKSNLNFTVDYPTSRDTFIQKYLSNVMSHNMHREQTYPNGAKLLANQGMMGCDFSVSGVITYDTSSYSKVGPIPTGKGSLAVVLNADLLDGNNTITYSYYRGHRNQYNQNDECTLLGTDPVKLDNYLADKEFYFPHDLNNPGENERLHAVIQKSTGCKDNFCTLSIKISEQVATRYEDSNTIYINGNFNQPLPSADWLVADRVVWQNLGSTMTHY